MSILKRKTSTGWEEVTPSNPFQVPVEIVGGIELPDLTNPGTAADLVEGKQLIDGDGNVITGTIPMVEQVTITPSKEEQTAVASGVYTTGEIKVGAIPDSYIVPVGTIDITENKTYDVTDYASANVNIATSGSDLIVSSSINVLFSKTLSETTTSTDEVQIGPKIKMKQSGTCNIVVNGKKSSRWATGTCYLYKGNEYTEKSITFSTSEEDQTFSNIEFNEDDTFHITVESSSNNYTITVNSISITGTYRPATLPTIAEEVTN